MKKIILVTLSVPHIVFAGENFWKTACTSAAIKAEFKINDSNPFEFKGNCSASIDGKYFEIINEGKKREFYFLDKIAPTKCMRFQPVSNSGDKAVCINGELGAYEVEYKGDKDSLVKKLSVKYGEIKKKITDTWYHDATINYYLFSNTSESYVVIKESVNSNFSGKPEYSYHFAYINADAYKKWASQYNQNIKADDVAEEKEKNKETDSGLGKIR